MNRAIVVRLDKIESVIVPGSHNVVLWDSPYIERDIEAMTADGRIGPGDTITLVNWKPCQ